MTVKIKQITVFEALGARYDSKQKAIDAIENRIADIMRPSIGGRGFEKRMGHLLEHRAELSALLGYMCDRDNIDDF